MYIVFVKYAANVVVDVGVVSEAATNAVIVTVIVAAAAVIEVEISIVVFPRWRVYLILSSKQGFLGLIIKNVLKIGFTA